jgi:hypothetical protein
LAEATGTITQKIDGNIDIILKSCQSEDEAIAFRRLAGELSREGTEYSIARESVTKFFNSLEPQKQGEFLTMVAPQLGNGKNVYDIAQQYMLKLLQNKH